MAVTQQQFRRVGHLTESLAAHLIDTELGRAAETVLYRTQHAVEMVLVTLELDYHINYVLKNLGACNGTVLCYVAYEYHRHVIFLRELEQHRCTLAHLCHTAGRGVDGLTAHCLNRIDDKQLGAYILYMCQYSLKRCLAHYVAVSTLVGDAVGTQFYLLHALLTRDIEHLARRHTKNGLQHKGGLAYTRLTTQQHQRTRHKATAKHTVKLGIVHVDAWQGICCHIVYKHRL